MTKALCQEGKKIEFFSHSLSDDASCDFSTIDVSYQLFLEHATLLFLMLDLLLDEMIHHRRCVCSILLMRRAGRWLPYSRVLLDQNLY